MAFINVFLIVSQLSVLYTANTGLEAAMPAEHNFAVRLQGSVLLINDNLYKLRFLKSLLRFSLHHIYLVCFCFSQFDNLTGIYCNALYIFSSLLNATIPLKWHLTHNKHTRPNTKTDTQQFWLSFMGSILFVLLCCFFLVFY